MLQLTFRGVVNDDLQQTAETDRPTPRTRPNTINEPTEMNPESVRRAGRYSLGTERSRRLGQLIS